VPPGAQRVQEQGQFTIRSIETHDSSGWHPVAGALADGTWSDRQDQSVNVTANGTQVLWTFTAVEGQPAVLSVHDHPDPLPAYVSTALAGSNSSVQATGLDGSGIIVQVADRIGNVPSAPADGVIVDLTYARRLANGNDTPATDQVWVRGPTERVQRALTAAGVSVVGRQSSGRLDDQLGRQGPGLASVLFLADAVAAAVLAALAAVLTLSAAARRRRYEYAALAATGATSRSLYAALAIEQLVVIGFGAATGVGAGLLAIALAGHSVPEFVTAPASSLIGYQPDALFLAVTLGAAVILMLAVAAIAAAALLRSVSPEQLREAPS
jgi:ABC-type antimicrobial peptide transport system permease subunit